MFTTLIEGDEVVKAEDMDTGRMYAKVGETWYAVPGTLAGHLRFHPYAEPGEADAIPGLDVRTAPVAGSFKRV